MTPRILFIDHHDSFSGNLIALIRETGCTVRVVDDSDLPRSSHARNAMLNSADALVLSPGPGHPDEYPQSRDCYLLAKERMPILGVCLGLQIVLAAHGCDVARVCEVPIHGRRRTLEPDAPSRWIESSFCGVPWVFFNSLGCHVEDPVFQGGDWSCVAHSENHAAWVEHRERAILLTQFHIESFGSPWGARFLRIWLEHQFGLRKG